MKEIIENSFNLTRIPNKDELVKFDGYDLFDKEQAIEIFFEKSCEQVYDQLVLGVKGTMSDIEVLQVLESYGLQYYLKSYLLYLFAGDSEPRNTSDFVSNLIFTLKEIIRIRGAEVFTIPQCLALKQIAQILLGELSSSIEDEGEYVYVKSLREHLNYIDSSIDPTLRK